MYISIYINANYIHHTRTCITFVKNTKSEKVFGALRSTGSNIIIITIIIIIIFNVLYQYDDQDTSTSVTFCVLCLLL